MKIRFLIVWSLVVALLCACSVEGNIQYTIFDEDGKYYMEFSDEESGTDSDDASSSMAISYPQFDSIADMQNGILRGNIPDNQIAALQGKSTNGILEICDPYNLYDLVLPSDLEYTYILWYGNTYSFNIEEEDRLGYMYYSNQETYQREFEEGYLDFPNDNHSVITDKVVADRNARVVHSMTHTAELKNVFYTVYTEHGDTLYVREKYVLRYFGEEMGRYKVSETVPESVNVFGSDGTNYYYGWFSGFEERPSVEWLSSFGLVPSSVNTAS